MVILGTDAIPETKSARLPAASAAASTVPPKTRCHVAPLVALLYVALNIFSACACVFANKLVLSTFGFSFPVALTFIHAAFTAAGMETMSRTGFFVYQPVPLAATVPVALTYVASIVLSNASLQLNTVGFYQACKMLITPAVVGVEAVCFSRIPGPRVLAATAVLLAGIAIATLTDKQVSSNLLGATVGLASTLGCATYQALAGARQRDMGLNASQLLHQCMPVAAMVLAVLVPLVEPLGVPLPWQPSPHEWAGPGTILGYKLTAPAVTALFASSSLGLIVSLSTFLVIGATSALTYNVGSHLKTIIILVGGVVFFGDAAEPIKILGLALALTGVIAYSLVPRS